MRVLAAVVAAALLGPVGAVPVRAAASAPAQPGVVNKRIAGHWTGAKLRCQKEEGKLLRCGTPASFEISFRDDGSGSTPDENLPRAFTWRWLTENEIGITPKAGGEEVKLFAVEREDDTIMTFQAYVYLPTADPTAPAEVRYIHYVFDVNRVD